MTFKSPVMKNILLLLSFLPVTQVICGQAALSPHVASYDIRVELNTEKHVLTGTALLNWTNPSADTVGELRFHLYMNAFKNSRSTFMKESGSRFRGTAAKKEDPETWGWIDITRMSLPGSTDLTSAIRFIQPDDGNPFDQTVIRVPLPEPVLPGKKLKVEIDFITKLPKILARTGYSGDFYLVAQWFPKLGVYEPAGMRGNEKGRWNCHQFHANSEFYADFGIYRVSMTLPPEYRVGATGVRIDSVMNADSNQVLTYLAEDVVDFAWTASPRFEVINDQWNDVSVHLMIQPEHTGQARRYLHALKSAMDYFAEALEPYPYPSITVVDPPLHGLQAGGMEYPMFITAGTVAGMPERVRLPESVTIHEFGHNYFMGILATHEGEEAWMDEGMNSYFESKIMDHVYGEQRSIYDFPRFHVGSAENQRLGYTGMRNPRIASPARFSWEFPHGGYGSLSYNKAATMLFTLENLVGRPTMQEIMKTYYRRWKFKHPGGEDFIRVVNEVVRKNHGTRFGENMNWFFDQVLFGSGICDYKLASVQVKRIQPPAGIEEVGGNKVTYRNIEYSEELYENRVIIHRLGDVVMPLEVKIDFDDGSSVTEYWDGKEETWEYRHEGSRKIVRAVLDPENKILLDLNRQNNSFTLHPRQGTIRNWAVNFLFILQHLFHIMAIFLA